MSVTMQTAKQDVRELLDHLPDDSTVEDIHYHFYMLEKIRRGEGRANTEGALVQDEAEARLRKWITK
ncbi:MAG TPA: hypothetical protein VJ396_03635 [Acidiferrobacterales bacterium]|nr:hypothetical protein [Acidiferrobacterales bacterium]